MRHFYIRIFFGKSDIENSMLRSPFSSIPLLNWRIGFSEFHLPKVLIHILKYDFLFHRPHGSMVERVTSNDEVLSSILSVGSKFLLLFVMLALMIVMISVSRYMKKKSFGETLVFRSAVDCAQCQASGYMGTLSLVRPTTKMRTPKSLGRRHAGLKCNLEAGSWIGLKQRWYSYFFELCVLNVGTFLDCKYPIAMTMYKTPSCINGTPHTPL